MASPQNSDEVSETKISSTPPGFEKQEEIELPPQEKKSDFKSDAHVGAEKSIDTPLLEIGETTVKTVEELISLLTGALTDVWLHEDMVEKINSGAVLNWLESAPKNDPITQNFIAQLNSQENKVNSLFGLLNAVKPDYPLYLDQKTAINRLEEIGEALVQNPTLEKNLEELLYSGKLETWVQKSFPQCQRDLAFLTDCRNRYSNRELGVFALQCQFSPDTPLRTSSEALKNPKDFITFADRDRSAFQESVRLLESGRAQTWLANIGALPSTLPQLSMILLPSETWEDRLESLLQQIDPQLSPPRAIASVPQIDLGKLVVGDFQTVPVKISNATRGFLSGKAVLESSSSGLSMVSQQFAGVSVNLSVEIDTENLPVGSEHSGTIRITSNGGNIDIPIRFQVPVPVTQVALRCLAGGGVLAGVVALVLQLTLFGGLMLFCFGASIVFSLVEAPNLSRPNLGIIVGLVSLLSVFGAPFVIGNYWRLPGGNGSEQENLPKLGTILTTKPAGQIQEILEEPLPNHPGLPSQGEVFTFLEKWLSAQNTGDFNAYKILYANDFLGVKRVGKKTQSFSFSDWLFDRKKMIESSEGINVSAGNVELYLVDFKQGVEFKPYAEHQLPHAKVIAIESEREFGHSVLQGLDAELKKRGELFRGTGANITEYRTTTGKPLPRILLIVDEYQEFFSKEDLISKEVREILERIVRQGRSNGIHIILSSQSLTGSAALSSAIKNQMAVRIALQCTEADSREILADDNPAARRLTRPGEAIYNSKNGSEEGNSFFQVALFKKEDREECLANVQKLTKANGGKYSVPMVFEGHEPSLLPTSKSL